MPLSPDNIETSEEVFSHAAFDRDIARMDISQLTLYIRKAFTGQTDLQLLPYSFWHTYFDFNNYGQEEDGRIPPSPGSYLGNLYVRIGAKARRSLQEADSLPDVGLRTRFQTVFTDILDECLQIEGQPDKQHLHLAALTAEAVGYIRFGDGPNSPAKQFGNQLKERGSISFNEAVDLAKNIEYPQVNKNEMFQRVRRLQRDGRYQHLEYPFF